MLSLASRAGCSFQEMKTADDIPEISPDFRVDAERSLQADQHQPSVGADEIEFQNDLLLSQAQVRGGLSVQERPFRMRAGPLDKRQRLRHSRRILGAVLNQQESPFRAAPSRAA